MKMAYKLLRPWRLSTLRRGVKGLAIAAVPWVA
jgi:hypothetical protein